MIGKKTGTKVYEMRDLHVVLAQFRISTVEHRDSYIVKVDRLIKGDYGNDAGQKDFRG